MYACEAADFRVADRLRKMETGSSTAAARPASVLSSPDAVVPFLLASEADCSLADHFINSFITLIIIYTNLFIR